ncbi:MAG: hypothetical protein QM757_00805 [Paludibaculum sp.]
MVALCDVDDRRAASSFKRYPTAPKYKDFRKMLDKEGKNIDAVIVAPRTTCTPLPPSWCMERGKHVYVSEAPRPHRVGSPPASRSRQQVQGRHADGQPGLLE